MVAVVADAKLFGSRGQTPRPNGSLADGMLPHRGVRAKRPSLVQLLPGRQHVTAGPAPGRERVGVTGRQACLAHFSRRRLMVVGKRAVGDLQPVLPRPQQAVPDARRTVIGWHADHTGIVPEPPRDDLGEGKAAMAADHAVPTLHQPELAARFSPTGSWKCGRGDCMIGHIRGRHDDRCEAIAPFDGSTDYGEMLTTSSREGRAVAATKSRCFSPCETAPDDKEIGQILP